MQSSVDHADFADHNSGAMDVPFDPRWIAPPFDDTYFSRMLWTVRIETPAEKVSGRNDTSYGFSQLLCFTTKIYGRLVRLITKDPAQCINISTLQQLSVVRPLTRSD